ncbi:MAG: response regulator [Candidatus Marinimicrobia bacterium]|nr:response regulator [Candidatus Neomarinimicrobiota bacterium]
MKVLVIDDDVWINKMIIKVLQTEGFEVFSGFDGKEGLRILHQNTDIDLIITDIVMPEKEGIETIIDVRKEFKNIKIIAISGGGKLKPEGYLLLARKLGADNILKKPFDNDELIAMVRETLTKN